MERQQEGCLSSVGRRHEVQVLSRFMATGELWAGDTDSYQGSIQANQKLIAPMARSCSQRGVFSFICQLFSANVKPPHVQPRQFQIPNRPQWTLSTECLPTQSLGNPIIAFLLLFCLVAIFSCWKAPFREKGPFYVLLKGFKPAPPLLNGWERTGPSFLWETQLAMGRQGQASIHMQPVLDGQLAPWLHLSTLSAYCHAKQQLLLQPRAISHGILKGSPPLYSRFVPQLLTRVIFVRTRDGDCEQTHLIQPEPL